MEGTYAVSDNQPSDDVIHAYMHLHGNNKSGGEKEEKSGCLWSIVPASDNISDSRSHDIR